LPSWRWASHPSTSEILAVTPDARRRPIARLGCNSGGIVGGPAYRDRVALPLSYRPNARLFIGDTGALMIDVVQATRRGQLTSLLAAIHHDAALLYVARHVLIEVERDLPLYAQRPKRPVDPDAAMKTWRTLYAPYIRATWRMAWRPTIPGRRYGRSSRSSGMPQARLVAARHDRRAGVCPLRRYQR
jgi:hypothetical protein